MAPELRPSCSDSTGRARRASIAVPLLATAKWYANNGRPVYPPATRSKTPTGNCEACRRHGRSSPGRACRLLNGRWCHGFRAATLNPDRIDQCWGNNPDFGVGVACGPAGLVIIDIDMHHLPLPARDRALPGITIADRVDLTGLSKGFHALVVLAALRHAVNGDEATLRVRPPSGGLPMWYRAQGGRRWQRSTGSSPGRAFARQVDVRTHGGYLAASGTVTSSPLVRTREPAPLPDWLAGEFGRTGRIPALQAPTPCPVPPRARCPLRRSSAVGNAGQDSGMSAGSLRPLFLGSRT